jgi:hypothetical protein
LRHDPEITQVFKRHVKLLFVQTGCVKIDDKIKSAKAEIEAEFAMKCEAHSSARIVKLIKDKEE